MKIFLDFDNTLVFTRRFFREVYTPALLEIGKTQEDIERAYQNFSQGTQPTKQAFSPKRHMELLQVSHKDQECIFQKIQDAFETNRGFLFPDAKTFLETTQRAGRFLLTYGDIEYQQQKIASSRISPFFENSIITEEQKDDIVAGMVDDTEQFMFVDDRHEYFSFFEKRFGPRALLVHMCHEAIGEVCFGCSAQFHIKNYTELYEIVVLTAKGRGVDMK